MSWKTRLTWPVRFWLLRWLDRPLARLLGCSPRMLSSRVEVQQVPFRGTPGERVRAWFWSKHTVWGAMGVALLTIILMSLAMYAVARWQPHPQGELNPLVRAFAHWLSDPSNERDESFTLAVAAASVLAGLFGVVQTGLIFLVELRGGRDGQAPSASPLILRRYFSFFVLAPLAGATFASVAALAWMSFLGSSGRSVHAIALVSLVAVAIALAAAFWLVVRILHEASESTFRLVLPVVKAAMRAQALKPDREARSREELRAVLAVYGAELVAIDRTYRAAPDCVDLELPLDSSGELTDVDCYRLRCAISAAQSVVPGSEVRLGVQLGPGLLTLKKLILRYRPTAISTEQGAPAQLSDDARRRIVRQFLPAFQIGKGRAQVIPRDVRHFIESSERRLIASAESGNTGSLREALQEYKLLVQAWIEVAPPRLAPPTWPALPRHGEGTADPLEINIYDVADAAVRSGDTSSVALLARSLLSLSMACFDGRRPLLGERLLDYTVYLYRRCARYTERADAVETELDTVLHQLHWRSRRAAEVGDAALRFGLALVHDAIRYGRVQAAAHAVQRILARPPSRDQGWNAPVRDDRQALLAYTAIMLTGWSLHVRRHAGSSDAEPDAVRDAANAAFAAALEGVPSDPAVTLAVWELYRDGGDPEPEIDRRLGVERWDVQEWKLRYRPGITEAYWHDTSWPKLGLHASLLHASEWVRPNYGQLFAESASRFTWKPDEDRKALEDSRLAEEVGISQDLAAERTKAALGIISQRAKAADLEYAQAVQSAPLSSARRDQFKAEALQALHDQNRWRGALAGLGVGSSPLTLRPDPCRIELDVPRECLIDGDVGSFGMGSLLGEGCARQTEFALVACVESLGAPAVELKHLTELPKLLRAERRALVDADSTPNAVILPGAERFAAALFDKPVWQVEGHGRFNGVVLGIWEGLTVLRCPYINASSAMVIDTTKLLTKLRDPDEPGAVTISFKEPEDRSLPEATAEAGKETPPSPLDIRVLVTLEAQPLIGIANPAAARRIDLLQSDGAYQLDEEQKIYHRPGCPEIDGKTLKPQVWRPDGMKPCPKCHPDRWDFEARWESASKP